MKFRAHYETREGLRSTEPYTANGYKDAFRIATERKPADEMLRGVEQEDENEPVCTCGVEVSPEMRARHGAELHSPYCPVGKRERA